MPPHSPPHSSQPGPCPLSALLVPLMAATDEPLVAPDKEQRLRCWAARDALFACLDQLEAATAAPPPAPPGPGGAATGKAQPPPPPPVRPAVRLLRPPIFPPHLSHPRLTLGAVARADLTTGWVRSAADDL